MPRNEETMTDTDESPERGAKNDEKAPVPETVASGSTVPSDSTGTLLTSIPPLTPSSSVYTVKTVSVSQILEDGQLGLRLYLGKPVANTFAVLAGRSPLGIVIEADPPQTDANGDPVIAKIEKLVRAA